MAERLTTQLKEGSVERLRTLAGGERKVGAFVSDVTTLLWQQREILRELTQKRAVFFALLRDRYRLPVRRYTFANPVLNTLPMIDTETDSEYQRRLDEAREEMDKLYEELANLEQKMDELLMESFQDTPIDSETYEVTEHAAEAV